MTLRVLLLLPLVLRRVLARILSLLLKLLLLLLLLVRRVLLLLLMVLPRPPAKHLEQGEEDLDDQVFVRHGLCAESILTGVGYIVAVCKGRGRWVECQQLQ